MSNIFGKNFGIIARISLLSFGLYWISKYLINYLTLEIILSLLLFFFFIVSWKIDKKILRNTFGILLFAFIYYSALYLNIRDLRANSLFNAFIIIVSLFWIFVYNRYFKLEEEERLPILDSFFERRSSFETIGSFISLGIIKVTFDIQILCYLQVFDANIAICQEALNSFYSIISQLFGIIVAAVIAITIFVVKDKEARPLESREKEILTRDIRGITIFSVPLIFLSLLGILLNKGLYIGKDMSSLSNSFVTGLFYLTIFLSIFGLLFIVMLIYDLFESSKNSEKTKR